MQKKINIEELEITIKYRKKMKNIYLRIEKNAEIIVTAPPRTPNYIIKKLVLSNLDEIKKRRQNIINNSQIKREFKSGEKYFIFAKEYTLEVKEGVKSKFLIENNKIILTLKNKEEAEKIFTKNIRTILYNEAENFIHKYEPLMNVNVNELRIKKMKTRWGTCNIEKKRIWINQELVKYPIECLEHIVVHELTHLLETNHTKRFYQLLGTYYPAYKENDKLIKDFTKFLSGR